MSLETLKDLVAGTLGGCASIIAGQPLDTVKTRLQSQQVGRELYRGTWDCAKQMLVKEGPRSYFKGMLYPLVRQSAVCCRLDLCSTHCVPLLFSVALSSSLLFPPPSPLSLAMFPLTPSSLRAAVV